MTAPGQVDKWNSCVSCLPDFYVFPEFGQFVASAANLCPTIQRRAEESMHSSPGICLFLCTAPGLRAAARRSHAPQQTAHSLHLLGARGRGVQIKGIPENCYHGWVSPGGSTHLITGALLKRHRLVWIIQQPNSKKVDCLLTVLASLWWLLFGLSLPIEPRCDVIARMMAENVFQADTLGENRTTRHGGHRDGHRLRPSQRAWYEILSAFALG